MVNELTKLSIMSYQKELEKVIRKRLIKDVSIDLENGSIELENGKKIQVDAMNIDKGWFCEIHVTIGSPTPAQKNKLSKDAAKLILIGSLARFENKDIVLELVVTNPEMQKWFDNSWLRILCDKFNIKSHLIKLTKSEMKKLEIQKLNQTRNMIKGIKNI